MIMKLLPYYKEDRAARFSGAISLLQNKNALSVQDAELISGYMSRGIVVDEWLSNIKDILTNELVIPSKTFSDGFYAWDASHIYYVRKYRARLPRAFISHVKQQTEKGFQSNSLDKKVVVAEFNNLLKKLASGDESFYDGTY